MKIEFPIVLFLRGGLTVEDKSSARSMEMKFPGSGRMLIKASAKKGYKEKAGWLLDRSGRIRDLSPAGRRREWATPISFLVQFVQSEFSMSDPREISVSELQKRLSGVKDRFSEAPIAEDLRRHLRTYPDAETLSERHLKEWPI